MITISSREYKVMLRQDFFLDRKRAIKEFFEDLESLVRLLGLKLETKLEKPERQVISFFDTPGHSLFKNGLLLRRRAKKEEVEYTLKCRSADLFFAHGTDVKAGSGLDGKPKFEEDIAVPFQSRFSHSTTIKIPTEKDHPPEQLKQAGKLFPVLNTLKIDGNPCPGSTELKIVNGIIAHERVYKGIELELDSTPVRTALILWTKGWSGRLLAAEFSFRYANNNEEYSRNLALSAQFLFARIQNLDWCGGNIPTKTQYVYGKGHAVV